MLKEAFPSIILSVLCRNTPSILSSIPQILKMSRKKMPSIMRLITADPAKKIYYSRYYFRLLSEQVITSTRPKKTKIYQHNFAH